MVNGERTELDRIDFTTAIWVLALSLLLDESELDEMPCEGRGPRFWAYPWQVRIR